MDLTPSLDLKAAPTAAILRINAKFLSEGCMPAIQDVRDFLFDKGIRYGIDTAVLEAALIGNKVDSDILVAKAKPPVPGKDAILRIIISPDQTVKPRIQGNDKADFREIGKMVLVKAGDVLAVMEPATGAVPGMDIFGKQIPGPHGKDLRIQVGPNTILSEDGRTLSAKCPGYLFRFGETLGVGTTYVVENSVDFNTGNIHFTGDIHVKGGVKEGFTVEATGSVVVDGEVDGATLISSSGSVTVLGGCFGRNKGRIEAKKEVRLSFVQQCVISCQSLVVTKAIQDCQVTAVTMDASEAGCKFFGGKVISYGSVFLYEAGAAGNRTEITIVDKEEEAFRREKLRMEAEEAKLAPKIEEFDRKLRSLKSIFAKAGASQVPPKVAEDIKTIVGTFQTLRKNLNHIQSEMKMLDGEINRPRARSFVLRILGSVSGSVNLNMFYIRRVLTASDSKKEFLVVPGQGLISK